jgi:hypothetical protein
MRIDLYTKFVLTVIALCLIWLSVGGPEIVAGVSAQQVQAPEKIFGGERVIIAGWADWTGKEHQFNPNAVPGVSPQPGLPVAVVFSTR